MTPVTPMDPTSGYAREPSDCDPLLSFICSFLDRASMEAESIQALHFEDQRKPKIMTDFDKFAVAWRLISKLGMVEPELAPYFYEKFRWNESMLKDARDRVLKHMRDKNCVAALDELNEVILTNVHEDLVGWISLRAKVLQDAARFLQVVEDVDYIIDFIGLDAGDKDAHGLYYLKGQAYLKLKRWGIASKAFRDALAHLEPTVENKAVKKHYEQLVQTCQDELMALVNHGNSDAETNTQVPAGASRGPKRLVGSSGLKEQFSVTRSAIKVETTAGGRPYLVAARDLEPGEDVIMDEPPFVQGLLSSCYTTHCHRCGVYCSHYIIPCDDCKIIVYCSLSCARANKVAHAVECPILVGLKRNDVFSIPQLLAVRALLKKDAKHWRRVAQTSGYDTAESSVRVLLDAMGSVREQKRSMERLNKFVSMSGYIQTVGSTLDLNLRAVFLINLLKRTSFWDDMPEHMGEANKLEIFLGGILYRYMLIFERRAMWVEETIVDPSPAERDIVTQGDAPPLMKKRIGFGIYPQAGLLTHSCAPNAARIFHGFLAVVFPIRPIKAGEPITVCYNTPFYEQPREARRNILEMYFPFQCDCPACREDWPSQILSGLLLKPKLKVEDLFTGVDGELRWPCCKVEIRAKDFAGHGARTCPKRCFGSSKGELKLLLDAYMSIEALAKEDVLGRIFNPAGSSEVDVAKREEMITSLGRGISLLSKYAAKPFHPVLWRWCDILMKYGLPLLGSIRLMEKGTKE